MFEIGFDDLGRPALQPDDGRIRKGPSHVGEETDHPAVQLEHIASLIPGSYSPQGTHGPSQGNVDRAAKSAPQIGAQQLRHQCRFGYEQRTFFDRSETRKERRAAARRMRNDQVRLERGLFIQIFKSGEICANRGGMWRGAPIVHSPAEEGVVEGVSAQIGPFHGRFGSGVVGDRRPALKMRKVRMSNHRFARNRDEMPDGSGELRGWPLRSRALKPRTCCLADNWIVIMRSA